MSVAFEATAPCRVDLAHGEVAVNVAIDRRAWCRVETGFAGVAVESKDTLQRLRADRVAELEVAASIPAALAREALRAFGVETGLRVVTQQKVPAASGLGGETALVVALVGALARALGRDLAGAGLARVAADVARAALGRAAAEVDVATAVVGGCVSSDRGADPAPMDVDPGAVEECLLLVEAGPSGGDVASAGSDGPDGYEHGSRVRAALLERRFEALASVLGEEWDALCGVPGWATPERMRIAACLRPRGAGLRACGAGRGTVVAIVAAPGARGPGPREAVVAAAKEASLRLFPGRVDLLGLDVEKTA